MSEEILVLCAGLALAYGAVSRLAENSVITAPMVFMAAGVAVSPLGLGLFEVTPENAGVELLAEIALIIILASDASQVDRRRIRQIEQLPIRLLALGLPLTMLLGAGLAGVVFHGAGIPFAALALLAVLLSPTDAALGQAVITSEAVPSDVRQALNVESGLNDGISLPPIFALLFVLGADLGDIATDNWLRFGFFQIVLGPLAGAVVGLGGGRLIDVASTRGWVDPAFQRLALPSIAVLGYALAEVIGGNGFIGAFVAGFMLGVKHEDLRERMQEFSETEGTSLSLIVMLMLGLVLIPGTISHWSIATTLYALGSLTIARMLPVALSLVGMGMDWPTKLFIGWFGPRGIASILYVLMWVRYIGLDGYETLIATGVQTIAMSVLLHGLTAAPLAKAYGAWKSQNQVPGE